MELYEKANELQNIVDTLDVLIGEIKDPDNKQYKDMLQELKYEVRDELEEIEDEIYTLEEEEQEELEREYDNYRI
jgi:hypothetical protein